MHEVGLAHCDIKPHNVVLTHDGRAKLADFGAACAINPHTGVLATSELQYSMEVDEKDAETDSLMTISSVDVKEPGNHNHRRAFSSNKPNMYSMLDSSPSVLSHLDLSLIHI